LKNPYTGVDRPVLDRTGLTGTFDFSLEWSQEPDPARPPGSQSEDTGRSFLEALQEQLGLKLKPTTGPVDVLVIDHVEEPSAN
jgi:bla regulator protein blaR1